MTDTDPPKARIPRWLKVGLQWLFFAIAAIVVGPPLALFFLAPILVPFGDLTGLYSGKHLTAVVMTMIAAVWAGWLVVMGVGALAGWIIDRVRR